MQFKFQICFPICLKCSNLHVFSALSLFCIPIDLKMEALFFRRGEGGGGGVTLQTK